MKDTILLYLCDNKIHLYIKKRAKEIIDKIDTRSFFKYGDIYNVEEFKNNLDSYLSTKKINVGLLKPNLIVLYNDITNCDLEYLYKGGLEIFNYNKIDFVKLSDIIRKITREKNIIVFDNYYTLFKDKIKSINIDDINYEYTLIGKQSINHHFYADYNIIWNKFVEIYGEKQIRQ